MRSKEKYKKVRFLAVLCAAMVILLCALPCSAQDNIYGEVTVPPNIFIGDVVVKSGDITNPSGILNLLTDGKITGSIGVEDGGILNLEGGQVTKDIYVAGEANIKGGIVGGYILGGVKYWDIAVETTADVTVFGTDFTQFQKRVYGTGFRGSGDTDYG